MYEIESLTSHIAHKKPDFLDQRSGKRQQNIAREYFRHFPERLPHVPKVLVEKRSSKNKR